MRHTLNQTDDEKNVIIPKGKWYYPCCQLDLQQTDENEEVSAELAAEYFDTKNEALKEIIEMYRRSEEFIGKDAVEKNIKECEEMMD